MGTQKIFVTGGSGFIGRNLCEQLTGDYDVSAPSHDQLDLLDTNEVGKFLADHHFDAVIHTATWNATRTSSKDISKVLDHNCRMFFNLAGHKALYGKMIYFGSGAEYDKRRLIPNMSEDYFNTSVPVSPYGFPKYIMARYTEDIHGNIYDLCTFGVYGKYEDWRLRFISNACCMAAHDMPITVRRNAYMDYLYIDDLVRVTKWFVENDPKYKRYNVCTGKSVDLHTLARTIVNITGKKLEVQILDGDLGVEYSGNNSRLSREMGPIQVTGHDTAIKHLYNWYLGNLSKIDKTKVMIGIRN